MFMAKKKEENSQEKEQNSKFSTFIPLIKDIFSTLVFNKINDMYKEAIKSIQKSIYNTTKNVIESAVAGVLLLLGIGFIAISLPFFLSIYMEFPPSLFFIIIGLILIIISVLMLNNVKKSKYNNLKEE
jgi:1,4-dihydroxy-2-naphthoate octaprenyltransferase